MEIDKYYSCTWTCINTNWNGSYMYILNFDLMDEVSCTITKFMVKFLLYCSKIGWATCCMDLIIDTAEDNREWCHTPIRGRLCMQIEYNCHLPGECFLLYVWIKFLFIFCQKSTINILISKKQILSLSFLHYLRTFTFSYSELSFVSYVLASSQ